MADVTMEEFFTAWECGLGSEDRTLLEEYWRGKDLTLRYTWVHEEDISSVVEVWYIRQYRTAMRVEGVRAHLSNFLECVVEDTDAEYTVLSDGTTVSEMHEKILIELVNAVRADEHLKMMIKHAREEEDCPWPRVT